MNGSDLKEYIRRVYQLEASLYQQNSLIAQLRSELYKLDNYQDEEIKSLHSSEKFGFSELKSALFCIVMGAICGVFLFGLASLGVSNDAESFGLILKGIVIGALIGATYFVEPSMPAAIGISVVCGTILFTIVGLPISIINELGDGGWWSIIKKGPIAGTIFGIIIALVGKRNRRAKNKKDNQRITTENELIQNRNSQNRNYVARKSSVLRQELQVLEGTLAETQQALNRYYGTNIIYPKYRELVAVSSFHEYLSSGRCYQLEGHEGAYNIFELETRQDVIIRKLDNIIDRLDRIEQNQHMLYSAIQESNRNISRMSKEMERTVRNIENNTAITAYNSSITVQNTECLKWLAVLQR